MGKAVLKSMVKLLIFFRPSLSILLIFGSFLHVFRICEV